MEVPGAGMMPGAGAWGKPRPSQGGRGTSVVAPGQRILPPTLLEPRPWRHRSWGEPRASPVGTDPDPLEEHSLLSQGNLGCIAFYRPGREGGGAGLDDYRACDDCPKFPCLRLQGVGS